jgi:hypothetical protein
LYHSVSARVAQWSWKLLVPAALILVPAARGAHAPEVGSACVVTPMESAWKLKTAWPEARFEVVWDAGHASTEPGIVDGLVRATDQAFLV